MQKIISPITKKENVRLVKSLKVKDIIKVYQGFKIDVNSYFPNLKTISIYECNETGYRFYYPFGVAGDSASIGTICPGSGNMRFPWNT